MPSLSDKGHDPERRGQTVDGPLTPRYFDHALQAYVRTVCPGECAASQDASEMLVTVLGSCIAACAYDPAGRKGAMNHFMLPGPAATSAAASESLRYGHAAMEALFVSLGAYGTQRNRLVISLFGGGAVIKTATAVGDENIAFIRRYMRAEGLAIKEEDLGGLYPRRVHFSPTTGTITCQVLRRSDDADIFTQELALRSVAQPETFEKQKPA